MRLPSSIILGVTLLLSSALAAGPAEARPWTVAVYLDADHNLDSSALTDLEEMTQAGPLKNVRVVYQLDRNDDEDDAGPGVERGVIENGRRVPVATLPELNSDDPKNVSAFLTWAYTSYPSTHRGLVMWDHGGQWNGGYGGDTHGPGLGDDQPGNLTPEAFARSLQGVLNTLGGQPLDFLGFDTCLMGGAELIAQFAPLTRLYIADAEIDYGDGWNYTSTLQALNVAPEMTMPAFGAQEVRFWEAQHRDQPSDQLYGVHAAYDTSRWPEVQRGLDAFATSLTPLVGAPSATGFLWRARGEAIQYDFDNEGRPGTTRPYVDLGHFAGKVAQYSTDAGVKAKASVLQAAIAKMVVAKSVGSRRKDASALSVYYPTQQETVPGAALLARYAALPLNTSGAWAGFQKAWTKAVQADRTPPMLKNVGMTGTNKDGSGHFEFTAAGADVYSSMVSLYQVLGKGQYLDFGDVYYMRLVAGDYEFDWKPQAWAMGDGKTSTFVTADHMEPDDELMSAAAEYTPPGGDPYDVIVQFNEDGHVFGVLDNSGDVPIGINVEKGGTLQFYLRSYDEATDDYDWTLQDGKFRIASDDLSSLMAELVDLPEGDFELDFDLSDYAGNVASDSVVLEIK